jgi:DNA-binding SARP family transcriptional activator/Tfp pilus assembly protein PilF
MMGDSTIAIHGEQEDRVPRFTVLGPVRAIGSDISATLPPKERTVLATLLLHPGEIVSADALARALWDDDPPPSARNTIQGHVRKLRQALGTSADRLQTRAPGYLIHLEPGELDLESFVALRDQASTAVRTGDWSRAADLLRDALALWPGEPLTDVPSDYLQRTEVPRLGELRQEAVEARIDAELRMGRHRELISELRKLVAAHPLRERPRELLMLAFYRAGRQGEALAQYQDARTALLQELGAEPGERLRRLHTQILAADPVLDNPVLANNGKPTGQPAKPDVRVPHQLPASLRDFTGRGAEARRLHDLLRSARPGSVPVAVISGTGGIGKSALAVHVAHQEASRYRDGQLFIELGGIASPVSPSDALARLLRDLGVADREIPSGEAERAARYRTEVADRSLLLVLDNAHDAAQVRPLLPGSGGSAVLVTSRATLAGLAGAAFMPLSALDPGESRDLLNSIIGDHRGKDDPDGTDAIVKACAGLPLAIRVAGSRLATQQAWTTSQFAALLAGEHERLVELTVGDTAVRASFEVSYLALPPDAARVFRMSGLPGLRTLHAGALAALAGQPVTEAVATLVDVHLLESPGPDTFHAHDLLRLYAAERAVAEETQQERTAALHRLCLWYEHNLDVAARLFRRTALHIELEPLPDNVPSPHVSTMADVLDWMRAEHANLGKLVATAKSAGLTGDCWPLALLLRSYFEWCGRYSEYVPIADVGLQAATASKDPAAISALLNALGATHWKLLKLDLAASCYERALALRREQGDKHGEAAVLGNLGLVVLDSGDPLSAIKRFTEALAINRELGYDYGEAYCLHNLGSAHHSAGRYAEALAYFQQALAIRIGGSPLDHAGTMHSIGALLLKMERTVEGMEYLERGLRLCQDNELRYGEGMTLTSLGDGYLALGEPQRAREAWLRALEILTDIGAPEATAVSERL